MQPFNVTSYPIRETSALLFPQSNGTVRMSLWIDNNLSQLGSVSHQNTTVCFYSFVGFYNGFVYHITRYLFWKSMTFHKNSVSQEFTRKIKLEIGYCFSVTNWIFGFSLQHAPAVLFSRAMLWLLVKLIQASPLACYRLLSRVRASGAPLSKYCLWKAGQKKAIEGRERLVTRWYLPVKRSRPLHENKLKTLLDNGARNGYCHRKL